MITLTITSKGARHVIQARTFAELRKAVEDIAGKGARVKRIAE